MKALIGAVALTSIVLLSVVYYANTTPKSSSVVLFSNPTNMAQELANIIVDVGEPQRFNVDSQYERVKYNHKFYSARKIYDLTVGVLKNGEKTLYISCYRPNRPLGEIKTPTDIIAQELVYSRSEIRLERQLVDNGVDMSVDIYQTFMKKRPSVYEGFSGEEKDSETSGVQQYFYSNSSGREFESGEWKVASKKTVDELHEYYKELLVELLKDVDKN